MPRAAAEMTARYRALCESHSVPVFHQPWWLDAACPWWSGVVTEDEAGAAIWPVPLEKKLGVRMTRNPAFTAYLGPVLLKPSGDYSFDIPPSLLQRLLAHHQRSRSLPQ